MKKFIVYAKMVQYVYLEVEAESKAEAIDIAENTDGGDFEVSDLPWDGDFIIDEDKTYELKEGDA